MMKKLSLILIEQVLLEGRLEDAKKKYPSIDDDFIDRLYDIDSSGNGKYLDWSLKVVSNLPPDDYSFEPFKMMDSVNYFHGNQQSFKEKDINQYTLDSLNKTIVDVKEKKELKKESKNIDKIYDNDKYLVVVPKTHSASCTYGSGTKWCITTRDSDHHWNRETSNAIMYFIFDKEKTSEDSKYKVALQFYRNGRKTWWDAEDIRFKGYEDTLPLDMMSKIEEHKEKHLTPLDGSEMSEVVSTLLGVDSDDIVEGNDHFYGMETFDVEGVDVQGVFTVGTSEQWDAAFYSYYEGIFYDESEITHYLGGENLQYHVYVSDTDRRMVASEEAQYYADEMYDEDELIVQANMEDEMEVITDKMDTINSEKDDYEMEDDYDKVEELEGQLEQLESDKESMVDEAREQIREEQYEEVYEGLDDPLDYYVNVVGHFSTYEEAFDSIDYIQIDVESVTREYADNAIPEELTGYSEIEESVNGVYYIISEIN